MKKRFKCVLFDKIFQIFNYICSFLSYLSRIAPPHLHPNPTCRVFCHSNSNLNFATKIKLTKFNYSSTYLDQHGFLLFISSEMQGGCWTNNSIFTSNGWINTVSAQTVSECQQACQSIVNCGFFQLNLSYSKGCMLLQSGYLPLVCAMGWITGPGYC